MPDLGEAAGMTVLSISHFKIHYSSIGSENENEQFFAQNQHLHLQQYLGFEFNEL